MSYQPEERYWTDYLRIALPVAGLLILIGLLWFWASALIGGPSDQPPATAAAIAVTPVNEATPPPAPTATAAVVVPTPGLPAATTAPVGTTAVAVATQAPPPTAAPVVTQPPAVEPTAAVAAADPANPCEGLPTYPVGSALVTTDAVRLREGPSTDTGILAELPAGTQMTVTGDFTEAGQCDWWPVTVVTTGQQGFVIEQFVQAAG